MAKKKVVNKKENKDEYTFTLKLGDSIFTSTDENPEEALKNLPKPIKIVQRGVLIVEQNGKSKERLMNIPEVKRLYYPLSQKFLIKYLIRDLR